MRVPKEVQERKQTVEVPEKSPGVAAFFDVDGTLVALPSLERRFFRMLKYRGEIPIKNYFLWLREALRLVPQGISAIFGANKMYLRGVHPLDERAEREGGISSWHKSGHQAEGPASAPPRRDPRLPVPAFFTQAIERVAWHARHGHEIVLVSGTLEPLVEGAARAIVAHLAERRITVTIRPIATRLEEMGGRWTGKVLGEAMFGEAKARAAERLAEEMQLDLRRCYAYGDSMNDRWLLALVGRPGAVNPSKELAGMARTRRWPVLHWDEKENPTAETRRARSAARLPNGTVRAGEP